MLLTDDHFDEVQARRRAWGADKLDEVWTGIPHLRPVGEHSNLQHSIAVRMRPAAAQRGLVAVLGAYEPRDVDEHGGADAASARVRGDQASTAALAVEIVTREDDVRQRLAALAADRIGEVVVVDLARHSVEWFALIGGTYEATEISRVIDLGPATLAEMIHWPAPGRE